MSKKKLTSAQTKLMNQYYHCTEPKENPDIDVFVCEDTADLHFIDQVTEETIGIVRDSER